MNRITSRLIARYGVRQLEMLHQANTAADAAELHVAAAWQKLLDYIRTRPRDPWAARIHIAHILAPLGPALATELRKRFRRLAKWGHAAAVDPLVDELPSKFVRARASVAAAVLHEEHEADKTEPGQVRVQYGRESLAMPGGLQVLNTAHARERAREPARKVSRDRARELFEAILFPPPSEEEVDAIVFSTDWERRIMALTGLAPPEEIAAKLTAGFVQGKSMQAVAHDLVPVLDGVRASARRVARTEGVRVGHESQMAAWENLGDLRIGYQIHATLDQHTRPKHAARNGTIYYREPAPGQESEDEMPRPPIEEDGSVAHNCRCHNTPVLRSLAELTDNPEAMALFTTAKDKIIPDPVVYSQWFDGADDKRRRLAVGARRYEVVRDRLDGRLPSWGDFLDPNSGKLMHVETLRREPDADRFTRRAAVAELMAERKRAIQRAAAMQPI